MLRMTQAFLRSCGLTVGIDAGSKPEGTRLSLGLPRHCGTKHGRRVIRQGRVILGNRRRQGFWKCQCGGLCCTEEPCIQRFSRQAPLCAGALACACRKMPLCRPDTQRGLVFRLAHFRKRTRAEPCLFPSADQVWLLALPVCLKTWRAQDSKKIIKLTTEPTGQVYLAEQITIANSLAPNGDFGDIGSKKGSYQSLLSQSLEGPML